MPQTLDAEPKVLIHLLNETLHSPTASGYLESIGPAAVLLRQCSTVLRQCCTEHGVVPKMESGFVNDLLDTLLAIADEQINTVDFHLVNTCWLTLYTDVSLLSALTALRRQCTHAEADREPSILLEAVRKLDMALIVAGGQGPGRLQWLHRAILSAQRLLGERQGRISRRPAKRARTATPDIEDDLLFAPNHIPSILTPPSLQQYIADRSQQPFVIRGYLLSDDYCPAWPAIPRWSDPEYLLSRVGEGRHVPVEVGNAYDDMHWTQRIVPFRLFLQRAGFFGPVTHAASSTDYANEHPPMYLAQHSLFRQFPGLEQDMSLPDYVWSAPSSPPYYEDYSPPATEDGVALNVWIGSGSRSIVSPPHTDPHYNCYAQVLGRKRVWLAPPSCGPHMSPHGQHQASRGNVSDVHHLASKYMNNTSTFPIFRSGHDRFTLSASSPSFAHHVYPRAMETVLGPGDLLIMPPGWWHAMTGEGAGPGWSVSMWY